MQLPKLKRLNERAKSAFAEAEASRGKVKTNQVLPPAVVPSVLPPVKSNKVAPSDWDA